MSSNGRGSQNLFGCAVLVALFIVALFAIAIAAWAASVGWHLGG